MNLNSNVRNTKTQSCIDIVRKRCKVFYMNFRLNMSQSNINKSVITVRSGHFMNSVFVNPVYSCAVDAILECFFHMIFGKGGEHESAHWQHSGIHPIGRQKLVPSIQICHSVFILPREERFMMRTAFFFRELLKNTVAVLHPFADIFNKFMIPALDLLRKCQGKMDCLVYEMLLNKKYRPSLNIQ